MKKIALFVTAALCFAAAGCQKIDTTGNEGEIRFNFNIGTLSADTKAAKTGWVAGDKVNVWFDGNGADQEMPDLILTFDGTNWNAGALRSGVQANLKENGYVTVVYEGYNDLSKYTYQWYNGNEWFRPPFSSNSFTVYDNAFSTPLVAYAEQQNYTFAANTVSCTISSWTIRTRFKVLVKGLTGTAAQYFLQVKYDKGDESWYYADASGAWLIRPGETSSQVATGSANNYGYARGFQEADGVAFYYNVFDVTAKDVIIRLYDGTVIKTFTATNKTLDATLSSKCTGVVLNAASFVNE